MVAAQINYWAVLVAGIASMIIGYVWYSMPVFGKKWMQLIGKTEQQVNANWSPKTPLMTFIIALVMMYILAHFVDYAGATTIGTGLQTGFWVWLGFVGATMLTASIYEGRSYKLWAINAGYQLANLLVAGAILAIWS